MRRVFSLFAALWCAALLGAPLATAHEPARVTIAWPTAGGRVPGSRLTVILSAAGGSTAASFSLEFDGRPVGVDGKVGDDAVFRTHTLEAGRTAEVAIDPVTPGEHELRVVHAEHGDASPIPDTVTTFTMVALPTGNPSGGGYNVGGVLIAVSAFAALGVIIYLVERLRGRSQA